MNEFQAWTQGFSFDRSCVKYQETSTFPYARNNLCSSTSPTGPRRGAFSSPLNHQWKWLPPSNQLIHPRHAKQVSTERVLIRIVDIVKTAEVVGPQRRPHVVETAEVEIVDQIRRHIVVVTCTIVIIIVWLLCDDRRCTSRACSVGVAGRRP